MHMELKRLSTSAIPAALAKAERYLEEALKWDRENPDILNALAEIRQGREPKESGKGIGSFFKKG